MAHSSTGRWQGLQLNTTASLPSSPISTRPARSSHTWWEVGEVKEDKERLNTMKPQHRKTTFQTRTPPKKKETTKKKNPQHKQWYLMRVSQRWPCGFLLLEGTCIFSQGFFSRSDREGVKLLSSRSQQGRTTHWGWRRHSYLPLYAVGKHTHKNTHQTRGVRVLFSRLNALIWREEKVFFFFLYMLKHTEAEILLNSVDLWMSLTFIWRKKGWQWKRRDYRCLLRG